MTNYQIGCFTRPWNQLEWEEYLSGVAGAGYEYVGFMRHKDAPSLGPDSTEEDTGALKESVARHGLKPSTGIASHDLGAGVDAAVAQACRHIDALVAVGCEYYMSCGTSEESQYETMYEVLAQAAPYGAEKGVRVTLKPHGGISATCQDLVRAVERVDHESFGIYFDAGNILYYTGDSPLKDLELVAPHVAGMCIKDETNGDGENRDVNLEPGTGDVDFEAVFATLKAGGFTSGPLLVECLGGETREDINARAKRVRERIEGWAA